MTILSYVVTLTSVCIFHSVVMDRLNIFCILAAQSLEISGILVLIQETASLTQQSKNINQLKVCIKVCHFYQLYLDPFLSSSRGSGDSACGSWSLGCGFESYQGVR